MGEANSVCRGRLLVGFFMISGTLERAELIGTFEWTDVGQMWGCKGLFISEPNTTQTRATSCTSDYRCLLVASHSNPTQTDLIKKECVGSWNGKVQGYFILNGNIQYVIICVWLLSLSIMFLRVSTLGISTLPLSWLNNIPLYGYTSFCSSIYQWTGIGKFIKTESKLMVARGKGEE